MHYEPDQNSCTESNHSGSPGSPISATTTTRNINTSSGKNNHTSGSSDQTSEKRYRPQKFCAVCGDKAIACNFNAVTCESCKKLKCLFEDRCVIDKVTRRFCSRCRLKKCIEIGMKREWILSDEEKFNKKLKIIQNRQKRQKRVGSNSHDSRASTPLEEYNERPTVEKRDASTSCPDELDLATGEGPGFFYCPHQCQNCQSIMAMKLQQPAERLFLFGGSQDSGDALPLEVQNSKSPSSDPGSAPSLSRMTQRFVNELSSPTTSSSNSYSKTNTTTQPHMQNPNYSQGVYIQNYTMLDSTSLSDGRSSSPSHHENPAISSADNHQISTFNDATSLITPESNRSRCDCHPINYDFMNNRNGISTADMLSNTLPQTSGSKDITNTLNNLSDEGLCENSTSNIIDNDFESYNFISDDDNEKKISFIVDESTARELARQSQTGLVSNAVLLPNGFISYDGGITSFAIPCQTDPDIEARLSSIELNANERAKIGELLQAARFLFDNSAYSAVRAKTLDALVDLVQMCDYSLRRFIKTVKQVDSFKILSMDDQISLLKAACFKILILRSAHHFVDHICGWPDSKTGKVMSLEVLRIAKKSIVYEKHKNLLVNFDRPLRQDKIIVGLLCMILLFDSSSYSNLQLGQAIRLEHMNYLCLLKKYLMCTQPDPLSKYDKLMNTLEQINSTNEEYNNFFSKDFQPSQITPLIVEIFDIGSI